MTGKRQRYTDDMGEMDSLGKQVPDFLPSSAGLAARMAVDRRPSATKKPAETDTVRAIEQGRADVRAGRIVPNDEVAAEVRAIIEAARRR